MRYKVGDEVVIKDGNLIKVEKIENDEYFYKVEAENLWFCFSDIMIDHEATAKLKGGQQMTKSDLKDGMVVEFRDGKKYLKLRGLFMGNDSWISINDFEENLISDTCFRDLDIVKVYDISDVYTLNNIFNNSKLTLLWQRQEKSEAEIKLEQLQQQIAEMKAKTAELEQTVEELKRGMAR